MFPARFGFLSAPNPWSCTMAQVPTPVVSSWSEGKDSAFGLWTLLRDSRFPGVTAHPATDG